MTADPAPTSEPTNDNDSFIWSEAEARSGLAAALIIGLPLGLLLWAGMLAVAVVVVMR